MGRIMLCSSSLLAVAKSMKNLFTLISETSMVKVISDGQGNLAITSSSCMLR